jgi:diguanylate cyclase (GGDEF)-like protein
MTVPFNIPGAGSGGPARGETMIQSAAIPHSDAYPVPTGGSDASPLPRPLILVVDDVFDNRDILTRRLVRRGFDVVEAAGGVEALEKIRAATFDIVLLDIMMPDMGGNEVLAEIRRTLSDTELPVIMVTAKSQSEDVAESLALGANDYVTKPVDFVVALARINAQLGRKRIAESERAAKREIERQAADLHHLAYHDALTGLLNRAAFRDLVSEALNDPTLAAAEPTVLFMDLDRFKAVNDVHGHEIGDKLLSKMAARLSEVAGDAATVARLGGDEFAIFLFEGATSGAGMELAQRIVTAAGQPFHIDGQPFQVGASCGVARASDCDHRLESMLKGADLAMYRAKLAGRGRPVLFEEQMLREQHERNALEVDLRQAIQDDALEVHYQPLVNTETDRITAFEALVRWPHPERGVLEPDDFIPLAEETGLIIPLGRAVLRHACVEAAGWPEDIRIAVNLSPLQFRDPELLGHIRDILAATGLDPKRLELEVTESALLDAGKQNFEIMRAIRALGIRVSMDDFGTGYSSLSYIQNFEFDKIKIDQRFIRDLRNGQNGAAIIKAIIDLGVSVGIETTAEGIETDEELDAVRSYGCVEMQGFLFSRPMDSAAARAFIEERSR